MDLALRESLSRQIQAMKAELVGPAPTPLKTLLVERIVACWLQVGYADATAAQKGELSIQQANLLRKRQDSAHRRYLTAVGGLAMVRRLLGSASGTTTGPALASTGTAKVVGDDRETAELRDHGAGTVDGNCDEDDLLLEFGSPLFEAPGSDQPGHRRKLRGSWRSEDFDNESGVSLVRWVSWLVRKARLIRCVWPRSLARSWLTSLRDVRESGLCLPPRAVPRPARPLILRPQADVRGQLPLLLLGREPRCDPDRPPGHRVVPGRRPGLSQDVQQGGLEFTPVLAVFHNRAAETFQVQIGEGSLRVATRQVYMPPRAGSGLVATGEFGGPSTPTLRAARDHWSQSMTAPLAGGGILGGSVYGATNDPGYRPLGRSLLPDDLAATIFDRLGFGPRHEATTASGRPIAIFREGRVLDSMIA